MPVLEDRLSATLFPAAEIPETAPEVAVGSGKPLRNGKRFVAAPSRDQLTFSARCTEDSGLEKALAEVEQEIEEILAEADAVDGEEDAQFGEARGDERARELARQEDRKKKVQAAKEALEENGQKRVSVTDPEALQQKVNDVCRPGYNS